MSASRDRDLLDALVEGLAPVRVAPPPAVATAAVAATGGLCLLGVCIAAGSGDAVLERLLAAPLRLLVAIGLAVAGIAGALAATRGAAPDRESGAGGALRVALAGLGLAGLACLGALLLGAVSSYPELEGPAHLACLGESLALSLVPLGVALACCRLGWVARPRVVATAALAGAVSLGTLAIHLVCPAPGPAHLLLGHLGAPAVGMASSALPVAALLRRCAR